MLSTWPRMANVLPRGSSAASESTTRCTSADTPPRSRPARRRRPRRPAARCSGSPPPPRRCGAGCAMLLSSCGCCWTAARIVARLPGPASQGSAAGRSAPPSCRAATPLMIGVLISASTVAIAVRRRLHGQHVVDAVLGIDPVVGRHLGGAELSDTSTLPVTFCWVSPSSEAMTRSTSTRSVG